MKISFGVAEEAIFNMHSFFPIKKGLIFRQSDPIAFASESEGSNELSFLLVARPMHIVVRELARE